jgi:predicted RNA-binding protein with PIN domain
MRLLIDGYNLCHGLGLLQASTGGSHHAGPHQLERARTRLLALVAHVAAPPARATVVFDAAAAPPGSPAESWHGSVLVRFAQKGSADDLIEELIAHDSDPRRLTVVSDDHRLREAGRRRGCHLLDAAGFEKEVERSKQPSDAPPPLEKPVALSEQETRRWLEEFGSIDAGDREWPEWEW